MRDSKNIKFTNKIRDIGPKLKWFLFTELQDLKLTSDYLNFICPDKQQKDSNPVKNLEAIVQEALIKEFSPSIQTSKSFDLLVSALMYKIQKKALEETNKTSHLS